MSSFCDEVDRALSAERFMREIKLTTALQEPRIVPVPGAGITDAAQHSVT